MKEITYMMKVTQIIRTDVTKHRKYRLIMKEWEKNEKMKRKNDGI